VKAVEGEKRRGARKRLEGRTSAAVNCCLGTGERMNFENSRAMSSDLQKVRSAGRRRQVFFQTRKKKSWKKGQGALSFNYVHKKPRYVEHKKVPTASTKTGREGRRRNLARASWRAGLCGPRENPAAHGDLDLISEKPEANSLREGFILLDDRGKTATRCRDYSIKGSSMIGRTQAINRSYLEKEVS